MAKESTPEEEKAKEAANKKTFYTIKSCNLDLQVKDVDTVGRTVCFIGNTLNYFDSQSDILLPGCATKSINENGPASSAPDKIMHAMFHDMTRIPGKFKVIEERKFDGLTGLYYESKLSNSTEGNDAMINYAAGIYNQHSIGCQYLNAEWSTPEAANWKQLMDACINRVDAEKSTRAYIVKEIRLFETSTVAFGANKLTPTLGIKSENKDVVLMDYIAKLEKLNQQLHSGRQSDGMMKTFEIQVLQLKQMIQDIFIQFGAKTEKEATKPEIEAVPEFDLNKMAKAMGV